MTLKVCETFLSIQGESTFTGRPCYFIRLSGCNLRCRYCDTRYAYLEGENRDIKDLVGEALRSGVNTIEVTGGEPLLQNDTPALLASLVEHGCTVLLETNGSISLKRVPGPVVKVMDLKCPSSGMSARMDFENIRYLEGKDQVKFVIQNAADYLWARSKIEEFRISEIAEVLISPVWGKIEANTLAGWILEDRLNVRLQIQLHKYLWSDKERAV